MKGLRSIVIKFCAFAAVAILLNTMLNGVSGSTREFHAEFTDVAGLRVGDDIRVAGVRVGRVTSITAQEDGAAVDFEVQKEQPVLDNTRVVMRYQNLLGQRYLALDQGARHGQQLKAGATIPKQRTNPGFDLTELLNGFRPLFEALRPEDVNSLATSLVKVLQGEGGTVETFLTQTASLTNQVADRDEVFDQVLTNLTPVLDNMAGHGTELRSTVRELRALMTGLARDRQAIGSSIDGMSQLIGTTSALLRDAREPAVQSVRRFRQTMELFVANQKEFVGAVKAFPLALSALGRAGSYSSALNIYLCSAILNAGGVRLNLNGGSNGPWSEVCQ